MTQIAAYPELLTDQYEWDLEKYHQLVESGILTKEDRVELLFGKLIKMSPTGKYHAACVRKLARFFFRTLLDQYELSQENPIILPDNSEPEPDYVIADLKADSYASGHPRAHDIHLIVEVADHTVAKDRGIKLLAYATAGIKEYWIINLIDRQIEQYREPQPDGTYTQQSIFTEGQTFSTDLVRNVIVDQLLT